MDIFLFLASFLLAVVSGRILIVGIRGGIPADSGGPLRVMLSYPILPCQIALAVWAFAALPWYWALASLVGLALATGPIVSQGLFPSLFEVKPGIDAFAIAGTVALWLAFFPF